MKNCRVGVACPTHGHVSAIRGNNYGQGGLTYHFSYDHDDQQNFADTDNVALLAKMGGKSDLVRLNFTAEFFLALYTGGTVDPQGCAGTTPSICKSRWIRPRRLLDGVSLILGDENHCLEGYRS